MSSPQSPLSDADLVELLDRLQQGSEEQRKELLLTLDPHVREEITQAFAAQQLLAQISPVTPPPSLPLQTARRTRRRLRSQAELTRNKTDGFVIIAVIALILSVIFLVIYKLGEIQKREEVKVIKLQLEPED